MKQQQTRLRGASLVVLALLVTTAGQASAGKPPRSIQMQIQSATLRDADGDVALSDTGGAYVADEFYAVVRDLSPSQPDGNLQTFDQDYLSFTLPLGGARFMVFDNAFASSAEHGPGNAETIRCNSSHFFFLSPSTPDFVEALQTVGASVTGFASTGCRMTDTFKYQANYENGGRYDCVRLTRSTETTLILTAPPFDPVTSPQCLSTIYTFDGSGSTILGYSSAPFEVTFGISTSGPGNGNGNAHGQEKH